MHSNPNSTSNKNHSLHEKVGGIQCCRDMVCSRYRDIVNIFIDQLFLNNDDAAQFDDDAITT